MAAGAFNLLAGALDLLQLGVSKRYNALHGPETALNMMVAMCDGGQYANTAVARMPARVRSATPQWLLSKLRAITRSIMEARCRKMLDHTVQELRKAGALRKPVNVAIDKTLFHFYGDHSDMTGRLYSKSDRGTHVFEGYATAQCVDADCRAHLAGRTVERGQFLTEIVPELLQDLERNGIKVRRLFVDREFFKIGVINEIDKRGIKYIMPAIKTQGVAAAIKEHVAGKRKAVSKYVMKSQVEGTEAEFTLIIIKKKKASDDAKDAHHVFATNAEYASVKAFLADVPREYKKRWGIETGFRDVRRIRPMTTSRSLSVRVAYFFFALAAYNAWTMVRYLARRHSLRGPRLIILMDLIVSAAEIAVPRDRGKPA